MISEAFRLAIWRYRTRGGRLKEVATFTPVSGTRSNRITDEHPIALATRPIDPTALLAEGDVHESRPMQQPERAV